MSECWRSMDSTYGEHNGYRSGLDPYGIVLLEEAGNTGEAYV